MSMAINMPLGGLINKSLKGEARFAHEEWLRTYVKRLTNGNKTKLKQALNEVDEAINQWRDGFFISTYDEKLSAVRQGKLNMDSQELEDVYISDIYGLAWGVVLSCTTGLPEPLKQIILTASRYLFI